MNTKKHGCSASHLNSGIVSSFTVRAYHAFVATQTEEKLRRENIKGKTKANQTHYQVGAKVCETIKELGGTMPEDLPAPKKSTKQLEREQKKLEGGE